MGLINPSLRSELACEAPTSRMQNFCANSELALNSNRIFHSSPFHSLGALSCHGGVEGHDCTHPTGYQVHGWHLSAASRIPLSEPSQCYMVQNCLPEPCLNSCPQTVKYNEFCLLKKKKDSHRIYFSFSLLRTTYKYVLNDNKKIRKKQTNPTE